MNKAFIIIIPLLFGGNHLINPQRSHIVYDYKKADYTVTFQDITSAMDSFFVQHPENRLTMEMIRFNYSRWRDTSCFTLPLEETQKCFYEKEKAFFRPYSSCQCDFRFAHSDTLVWVGVVGHRHLFYGNRYYSVSLLYIKLLNSKKVYYREDLSKKEIEQISERFRVEFVDEIEKIMAKIGRRKKGGG